MLRTSIGSVCASLMALLAPAGSVASTGSSMLSDPIATAIRHRHCDKAITALNAIATNPDVNHAFSLFVGGRMLDEGICTAADPNEAAKYFQLSAQLGAPQAQLDFATKMGMGQGTPQDYASAGRACHHAGVDPDGLLPSYSVGYACTVGGVAGQMLRKLLPAGAFRLPTPPAVVEFELTSSQIRIVSVPEPQHGPVPLGSIIAPLLVEPRGAIVKAFRDALARVPKPDSASLSSGVVTLSLDLDITLEGGAPEPTDAHSRLLPGDITDPNPFG